MAPMERPQRMNFSYPISLRQLSVLSLRLYTLTNVILFFGTVGDPISLTFAAAREVNRAQSYFFRHEGEQIRAFKSIGPVAMQEEDTSVRWFATFGEETGMETLVVMVKDGDNSLGQIVRGYSVF